MIETTAVLQPREFPTAVNKWAKPIVSSAAKHGVPASLVAAFMATESGGNPNAATFCCYGLMGFLPATASWVAGRQVTPAELTGEPELSIDLGAKLIRMLWDKYNGNVVKMAATYNAGSVKCGAPGKCPNAPNQWKVITDCAQGKAVDYPGRIILHNNQAVESGLFGPGAAGGGGSKNGLLLPLLLVGGVAGAWYFTRGKR
ncbi:MAG: transglycosylase SLT domain-containing protein [Actinomycetota bacterium]|nr:transglycosylase SLT domain-containing protein [Actinomycetota bacterium]